jgi:hypothetical protein
MLTLPMLLGAVLAGVRPSAGWLMPWAVVAVFLAHNALFPVVERRIARKPAPADWLRRRLVWGGLYLSTSSVLFALVVVLTVPANRGAVIGLSLAAAAGGAFYFIATCFGVGRLVACELVGMAALSLSAPIMALAAGRPFETVQLGAALLAFVYSASALSFVRAFGATRGLRVRAIGGCVVSHLLLIAVVAWVARDGWLPAWWLLAFVPLLVRLAWSFGWPPRNLRLLGLREIWVAAVYTVIVIGLVVS